MATLLHLTHPRHGNRDPILEIDAMAERNSTTDCANKLPALLQKSRRAHRTANLIGRQWNCKNQTPDHRRYTIVPLSTQEDLPSFSLLVRID